MSSDRPRRLLVLTDWEFPCEEPFMREVYAKRWVNAGHEVVWIMRPPANQSTVSYDTWNGSPVYIAPSNAYKPQRALIRHLRGSSGIVGEIWDQEGPFDLVQVRNDLAMGLTAIDIARSHEIPFVFRHSHLKAEELILAYQEGIGDVRLRDYFRGHLGQRVRDYVMDRADLVLSISDSMTDYLNGRGVKTQIRSLPMGADTTQAPEAIDPTPFLKANSLTAGDYAVYIGTMKPFRRVEFLFDVLSQIHKHRPDFQLGMVGGRSDKYRERLRNAARETGVESSVVFTGWISDERLRQAIVGAGVGLSPIVPNPVLKCNSPTKLFEYLNLSCPVVANDTPEQRAVLTASGGGVLVPYDAKAFAQGVLTVLADEERATVMGRRGRQYILENRSYDILFQRILSAYDELLGVA